MDIPNILSLVTYLPAAAALVLLFIPYRFERAIKSLAFLGSVVTFILSLHLTYHFDPANGRMQFEESAPWIRTAAFHINHHLGIDGISLFLVILTTFLTPLAILCSWKAVTRRVKPFMICLLALETGMVGVFCALDLVLFYVFWEVMLIPMYFLIGIWGGERRIYAAVKFILYTMAGSLLMLVAILYLFYANGGTSFNLLEIGQRLSSGDLQLSGREGFWLFLAFLIAFAIKVPMFPFHTWLPDAHVEAPTAGSVILAGVLLKMGAYGFIRFCLPLFPVATFEFMPLISVLAVIGIIYGALVSMVQNDIKSLVAFSSVSHMGFVMLGMMTLNLQGMEGSIIQMVNHGISTGALFILVGMIYERRHTRLITEYGGLAGRLPLYSTFFMIIMLSSIGVPGTNGFVGEFTILLGAWSYNKVYAVLAASGVILAACYMLWLYQRVFYGNITNPANEKLVDLGLREKVVLVPLVVMVFWIGLYPKPFFAIMEPSVKAVIAQVERGRQAYEAGRIGETTAEASQSITVPEKDGD